MSASSGRAEQRIRIDDAVDRVDEVVEELEERRLRRVDVVDDDDQRSRDRLRLEQLPGAPEQLGDRDATTVDSPTADATRSTIASRSGSSPARSAAIRARAASGESSSTICAAERTISTSGQNVIPSP